MTTASTTLSAAAWALLASLAFIPPPASGQSTDELAALVNAYRNAPQTCDNRPTGPSAPLARNGALDRIRPGAGEPLDAALGRAGYNAARAQSIVLSGPRDARSALALAVRRYCTLLLDPQFSELGVSREGATWRLVLARPLIARDLGDWRTAGREILELVNAARAQPRQCGARDFSAAPPLKWNEQLASASVAHSRDMATQGYLEHVAPDGSQPGDRASRAGYKWRRIAENIAAGQGSARHVVSTWLASPEHCENIMERAFTETGAAYFINPKARGAIYWTQMFGATR